jgi:hypothetical protein
VGKLIYSMSVSLDKLLETQTFGSGVVYLRYAQKS